MWCMIAHLLHRKHDTHDAHSAGESAGDPREIARSRFARGEINADELRRLLTVLDEAPAR